MPKDVHRDEIQLLLESGAQLVEVLPEEEYNQAHLPGAINIPLKKMNKQSIQLLDRSRPVIVYCSDFQ
jgi:rhodanese-related sulfurtransferase